ncbi:MAG: lamin tail domain-containing protein [Bacteroidetes bacterium]|nr:lamin tail domain-containing protein [Bacteroidota bacterium]
MKNVVLFIFLIPCCLSAQVIINEIAPNNRYFFDEDSIYPDWIEIMNIGVYNIDLAQFSISDNSTNVTKWLFPDTVLYAGEKLIVFASDKNRRCFDCPDTGAYLHTNFKLSTGEKLILYSNAGELLDSVTIRDVYAGDVMVRIPDGGDWCLSNTPTPLL